MKDISELRQDNTALPLYVAYIVLPTDVDRDDFVKMCYRRERVSILVDRGGGTVNDCYIDKDSLQNIKFPSSNDGKSVGSPVVIANIPTINLPIVIAVLSTEDETQLLNENTYQIKRNKGSNISFITCNGDNGKIDITASGKGISLNCTGEDSQILINSLNTVLLKAKESFNISSNTSIGTSVLDSSGNESRIDLTSTQIDIVPYTRLNLFGGGSPLVLGDNNTDILNDIQSVLDGLNNALIAYSNTQTSAASAATPLLPLVTGYTTLTTTLTQLVALIQGLVVKIQQNNSTKSFTD